MATKLCLRAGTHFFLSSPSLSFSRPLLPRFVKPFSSSRPSISPIKMSTQTVEHIVLFKVKPETDPSKIDSMVNGLRALSSLDKVLHLTTGPVLRTRSSSLSFTHMLHGRFQSKEDVQTYLESSSHIGVVTNCVLPICEDLMLVDWVASGPTASISPGSAMRVTFFKLKEGLGESEKTKILGVIGGIKDCFPSIDQLTCGENFLPERAKGYSIASIAVFPGLSELEALDSEAEMAYLQKEKVKDLLESVVVVDYEDPRQQSAASV